jgi:replicative DNA helicase
MSEKTEDILELFTDPVKWCESFLKNPNDKEEPIVLRSYQREIIEKTRQYRRIILRYGRRMGKSITMCADTLWWCSAYPLVRMIEEGKKKQQPFRVLIATPYETQIKELWAVYAALIADSPLLREQITKIRTSDVHTIEFDNGSRITGYTIGISSSNRGTSLRSLSADMVFLDEMDFIPREIIEQVIMPIWTTHTDTRLRVCSTPSGKREMFWEWCTKAEELGWLHRHYASWHPDNTNWMSIEQAKAKGMPVTESTEYQVKAITSASNFEREYGAEFGEEFGGVYKNHLLNKSLVNYGRAIDTTRQDVFDPGFTQKMGNYYIIGVDWNSYMNGGQVVMVEYCREPTILEYYNDELKQDIRIDFTGKYRLFYRKSVAVKDATQRKTREEIVRLLTHYKIDYVYVDYGAGDTNIEELTLFGRDNPMLGLNRKLKVIDSGASVEHWDPVLGKLVKKRNKSLMVNFSALNLEEGLFILPKEEDEQVRLIGQMRGYQIKNITSRGDYTYEGEDHILDAFNLAVYGFQKEYGEILNNRIATKILFLNDPRFKDYPTRVQEVSSVMAKPSANIRDPEKVIQKPRMLHRITMPQSRPNINFRSGRSSF